MAIRKFALALAALGLISVSPLLAQDATDGANMKQHHWQMPNPADMAAWHAQMCKGHYAREAGKLAYLQADLSITDAQRGAFDRWRDAVLSTAKTHSEKCLAHAPGEHHMHDALERNAQMQKRLENRLADLKSERPALETLYASLTPDQKNLFDRAGGMGHHHGHHMGGHMGERFGEGHEGGKQRAPG